MIYLCTKALNRVDAFNIRIINNKLFLLNETIPSFTAIKDKEEVFKFITMSLMDNIIDFSNKAKEIINNQKTK